MMKSWKPAARIALLGLSLILILSSLHGLLQASAQDEKPIVRMFFFYDVACEHCQVVIEQVLPVLWDQHGGQLEIRFFEVNVPHNYQVLLKLEGQYHDTAGGWPAVFIGQDYIYDTAVKEQLPVLVDRYMAEGGCDWPSKDWSLSPAPEVPRRPTPTPGPSPTPGPTFTPQVSPSPAEPVTPTPTIKTCAHCGPETPTPTPRPAIHMAYFFDPSCPECLRAEQDLNYLERLYPELVIERFNIEESANKKLAAALGERLGIPMEKWLATPTVIVGQDYLIAGDITQPALQDLVNRYRAQGGAEPSWENIGEQEGTNAIIDAFKGFSLLAVLGAGLIDGLNPCAFATLIFFISYLTFTGRKGRDVLLIGGLFTASVFVTYLLIGAGILTFLKGLAFVEVATRIIYGGTALACLVFGVLSLYDLNKIRLGQSSEMALQLPDFLKRRTRQLIREESREAEAQGSIWRFVVAAVVAGFGISVLELVCTGQVYLPTIIFVMGMPELAANGFLYLVLYNLMFVAPLVVVFVLAYLGTSSQQLSVFMNDHLALVKGLTAGLFFVLAVWLVLLIP